MACQTEQPAKKDAACQTHPDMKHMSTQHRWKPERRSKSTQVKQQKRHVGCNTSTPFIPLEKGPLATSTPLKRPRREAEDSDCSFKPGMTDSSIYNERTQLAAMHFNENSGRPQATTAAGELRWHMQYPRYRRGEYTVRLLKRNPTFEYVDRLQDLLFESVLEQPQLFQESLKGLQVPDHLCTQFQRPEKSEAVAQHTSRFRPPSVCL